MTELTALRPPRERTAPITHPAWCEHGACTNDLDSANVEHRQRVKRWLVMDDDLRIEVDLVADDEYTPWDGQFIPCGSPVAEMRLHHLASNHHVPCHIEHEVPIKASAYLNAEECRRFAAVLLDVADRVDAADGAR